jgi:hypothetical protein
MKGTGMNRLLALLTAWWPCIVVLTPVAVAALSLLVHCGGA